MESRPSIQYPLGVLYLQFWSKFVRDYATRPLSWFLDLFLANDEHVHHYQRGRASITGLRLWSGKIIETERLVVVARCGLLCFFIIGRLSQDSDPVKMLLLKLPSPAYPR
jgi:hypothetical protein